MTSAFSTDELEDSELYNGIGMDNNTLMRDACKRYSMCCRALPSTDLEAVSNISNAALTYDKEDNEEEEEKEDEEDELLLFFLFFAFFAASSALFLFIP